MTTPKLDQARAWAEGVDKIEDLHPNPRAAVGVIQSLPDQWIDAKELREIYDRYRASEITLHEAFHATVALTTPPLPTLADMTAEEQEACQWMQAQVFTTATTLGIITGIDEHARSAIILFADGMAKNVSWAFITPLPDLPKLEWPGGVVDAEIVEDEPIMVPRPEDIPSGKPWIVKCDGHEWVGARDSKVETVCSWALARLDGADFTVARDDDITLISRLVPEVTP